jgi:hypothetical protein
MSGWYDDGSEEQAQAERRWAAQKKANTVPCLENPGNVFLVGVSWYTLQQLFPNQLEEFFIWDKAGAAMQKPVAITLNNSGRPILVEYKP